METWLRRSAIRLRKSRRPRTRGATSLAIRTMPFQSHHAGLALESASRSLRDARFSSTSAGSAARQEYELLRTRGALNPWEISHHSGRSGRGLKSFQKSSVGPTSRRNPVTS